ncbi:MAG: hypothetical protein ABSE15_12320 [Candidatus Bathyarchaeia archaeon]|jgi:hypothetical protein
MSRCAFLTFALVLFAISPLVGAAFAQSSVVGVKASDWIRYDVREVGSVIDPEYNITWARMDIVAVQDDVITVNVLTQYGNGTLLPENGINLNVTAGKIGDGFFVPVNLKPGDRYSTQYEGIINMTSVAHTQAGGATRAVLVGVASLGIYSNVYNWDKRTGIMVSATSNLPGCVMYTTTSSTNLWAPQILGLSQTVFYALVLSIIGLAAVLTGAVLLFVMRKKKQFASLTPKTS